MTLCSGSLTGFGGSQCLFMNEETPFQSSRSIYFSLVTRSTSSAGAGVLTSGGISVFALCVVPSPSFARSRFLRGEGKAARFAINNGRPDRPSPHVKEESSSPLPSPHLAPRTVHYPRLAFISTKSGDVTSLFLPAPFHLIRCTK